MNLSNSEKQLVQIQRACFDLRHGLGVIVKDKNNLQLVISADDVLYINSINEIIKGKSKELLLGSARINYLLSTDQYTRPVVINCDSLSFDQVKSCASKYPFKLDIDEADIQDASDFAIKAHNLIKIAELLPALIIIKIDEPIEGLQIVESDAIDAYQGNIGYSLIEGVSAPLTLQNAKEAQIKAYRPNIGAPEHYAIIIGQVSDNPLVRVHSSCYTGDLLASLACDCKDQLQSAIELMANNGGGIILYLLQDGRGIGLVNKLHTYNAQHEGLDTVEANRVFGFEDDERLFVPAATILKKLNITKVKLLSNNPLKATSLEKLGIKVTELVSHVMDSNEHNAEYLKTKSTRMGHKY